MPFDGIRFALFRQNDIKSSDKKHLRKESGGA